MVADEDRMEQPVQTAAANVLAFVSDTQAPMLVETILLRSHNNRRATALLFGDMVERLPAAIFHLGDVVNLGYSRRQWRPIDQYLEALRLARIPVHAILGNHEVMGRSIEGQRMFQKRFPDHRCTGYAVRYGTVAVLLLNSNFSVMTSKQIREQDAWLGQTLHELDGDAAVQAVIVGCHHSPYTNSRIVRPSKEVEQRFVPPYLASRKALLFLSGHCHAFEHYKVKGKDFLVIGGGGGLRQPLRQGLGTLADLSPDYKPLFHYITITSLEDSLWVTSYHIKKDFTGFEEGRKMDFKKA